VRSFIRQSEPFQKLLDHLRSYLEKFEIDCCTDVFEHSFLHLIGYKKIPERCKFSPLDERFFCIDFNAPFGLTNQDVITGLSDALVRYDFKKFLLETIDPINRYGFMVRLRIPYEFIDLCWGSLKSSILHVASRWRGFYLNWQAIINERNELTNGGDYLCGSVEFIKRSVRNLRLDFPYLSTGEIWNHLLQYLIDNKDLSIKNITAYSGVDRYPNLTFNYLSNNAMESIMVGKDQLLMLLYIDDKNRELKKFIAKQIDLKQHQCRLPEYKQLFLEKINNSFFIRENGFFTIDLSGYLKNREKKNLFARYGLDFTIDEHKKAVDGSVYYEFTPEDYVKAVLAIKEIEGEACIDERWHELEFLFRKKQWENLKKQFLFLLSLSTVEYALLVFKVYNYAKEIESKEFIKFIKVVGNTILANEGVYRPVLVTAFSLLFLNEHVSYAEVQRYSTGSSHRFFNVDPNDFNTYDSYRNLFELTRS
jgi:hypothetical protein